MFYKIIYNNMIIDILENPKWVIWLKRSCRFLQSERTTANGIISSSGLEVYNIIGRGEFENRDNQGTKSVLVVKITESEYNHIKAQLVDKVLNATGEEITINDARVEKIAEMKLECEKTIIHGFDIILSDNLLHHFSLEIPDQLKILKLNERAISGIELLPYHADGEVCKFYTKDDIININANMEYIVEYQTTYFNSLKVYINNIFNVATIKGLQYGCNIPEEFQSDVLKFLLHPELNNTEESTDDVIQIEQEINTEDITVPNIIDNDDNIDNEIIPDETPISEVEVITEEQVNEEQENIVEDIIVDDINTDGE